MDQSSPFTRPPLELEYLEAGPPSPTDRSNRELSPLSREREAAPKMTQAASQRLSKLARLELAPNSLAIARPEWLQGKPVPRLLITARYDGNDAYGAARLLADLDLAARRAAALHRRLLTQRNAQEWPRPLRTYQGGLRLLDARLGSFDVVTTVWGSLVSIASSSPVVVASLIALAWDVTRGTKRLADRWVGSALDINDDGPPVLQAPTAGEPWGVQHTKAFIPVLDAAIANGQGVEYFLDEADRTLKITVLPKDLGER